MAAKKLNIEAILKKHHANIEPLKQVHPKDGNLGTTHGRIMAAFKEVIEEVLKLAAENASAEGDYGCTCIVDKQSILDTSKQVEYE